jgi:hypothetical protein
MSIGERHQSLRDETRAVVHHEEAMTGRTVMSFERRSSVFRFVVLAAWLSFVAFGTDSDGVDPDMGEFLNNPVQMLEGELP